MLAGRGAMRTTNMQMHTGGIRTGSRKRCMLATMHTIRTIMTTVTTMGTAMPIKTAAVAGAAVRQPCIWPSRSTWQAC